MTDTLTDSVLDYYAAHGAALFPIPYGSKAPHGLVPSFKHDYSTDPAQWAQWRVEHPRCNFGVVAFASHWIILDTDTSGGEEGRAEAWKMRGDLFASWGLDPATLPHCQSARGGWHDYFQVPAHIDASTLRQPDAIKKRINVRCIGYAVAAGSYYDGTAKGEESGHYALFPNAMPPHSAPAALIEHCTRAERTLTATAPGSRDKGDVAALLTWLNDKDVFAPYEDWCAAGMALKLEYGDDGLSLWELCHDETVTSDVALAKWDSFATEPTAQSVTLNTFMDRAHKLGWRGSVRKSTAAMFSEVAQLAAASGASLSGAFQGMPMLSGQAELTRLALPLLETYLATSKPAPPFTEAPALPSGMSGHGLYDPMQACLPRLLTQPDTDVLAVLSILHADVFNAVLSRLSNPPTKRIRLAATNLSEKIERITIGDGWINDPRTGLPENDNSDNCAVLIAMLGLELRWNGWIERMEIRGGIDADLRWPEWSYVDDTIVARLRTRANRTKTRFRPAKEFFWETCLTLAHANTVDPVCDLLKVLEDKWDGVPRLDRWLVTYCGVLNDNHGYHQAVARSLVGGMVSRIRSPGVKFDTMPIFFGPQGTGKSTMLAILAMAPEYFSDSILLGDASKELVLSLAGKTLVEISEMGMRGNTNVNHVKAMISRTTDAGRTAYARAVTERARRNIFCGSTNEENPLEDASGNRRFLPVRISQEIDLAGLRRDVFQLVGEAAALHARGEDFSIPRHVWAIAAEHQEAARATSSTEDVLGDWFSREEPNLYVLAGDIGRALRMLGIKIERYGIYMQRLGWTADRLPTAARTKVWRRGVLKEAMALEPVQAAGVNGRVEMRLKMKAPYA